MDIQQTLLKLLIKEPFYGHVASKLQIKKSSSTKKINIQAYPRFVMSYNPQWFHDLEDNLKYGYILHELLHVILQHNIRIGKKSAHLWAVACDMAVNQYIDEIYIDDNWINIEIIAFEFNVKIRYGQSCEYYYNILDKLNINIKGKASSGQALITLNNREYKADIISDNEPSHEELSLLKTVVSKSIIDSGLDLENITELYSDYIINWRAVLKRFLSGKGRRDKRKSYKKVSRRYEHYPGNIYNKGVVALIALDESGSMPDHLIQIYIKELIEINKITGVKIQIVRFDSQCSTPIPLKQYIQERGRHRRGSTDFNPIFKLADEMKIPLVVIFTDGKGLCPDSVNQKVLWLLTKDGENPSSFGEVMFFTN
ncbi:MAG: VWA-like domain-containing protein [Spirochaetaceae bacterium]